VGSIALAEKYSQIPVPAYKVSKAALNMLTRQYALDLSKEGLTFVMISPGVWVELSFVLRQVD
jgi:NAD(P)-dependent dehydrogenase (short-subunit alcohol dehydrogenase family)